MSSQEILRNIPSLSLGEPVIPQSPKIERLENPVAEVAEQVRLEAAAARLGHRESHKIARDIPQTPEEAKVYNAGAIVEGLNQLLLTVGQVKSWVYETEMGITLRQINVGTLQNALESVVSEGPTSLDSVAKQMVAKLKEVEAPKETVDAIEANLTQLKELLIQLIETPPAANVVAETVEAAKNEEVVPLIQEQPVPAAPVGQFGSRMRVRATPVKKPHVIVRGYEFSSKAVGLFDLAANLARRTVQMIKSVKEIGNAIGVVSAASALVSTIEMLVLLGKATVAKSHVERAHLLKNAFFAGAEALDSLIITLESLVSLSKTTAHWIESNPSLVAMTVVGLPLALALTTASLLKTGFDIYFYYLVKKEIREDVNAEKDYTQYLQEWQNRIEKYHWTLRTVVKLFKPDFLNVLEELDKTLQKHFDVEASENNRLLADSNKEVRYALLGRVKAKKNIKKIEMLSQIKLIGAVACGGAASVLAASAAATVASGVAAPAAPALAKMSASLYTASSALALASVTTKVIAVGADFYTGRKFANRLNAAFERAKGNIVVDEEEGLEEVPSPVLSELSDNELSDSDPDTPEPMDNRGSPVALDDEQSDSE